VYAVYDPEPPLPGNPLLQMENVIVTPHFCAMMEESLYNMATMVAQGFLNDCFSFRYKTLQIILCCLYTIDGVIKA